MAGVGRIKGSKNKRTLLRERGLKNAIEREPGFDPHAYAVSVGRDPRKWNQRKSWAAELLMPYMYPRLSATKIDATVKNDATGEQITDADRLVDTVLTVKADAPNGHAKPNGSNGASKGDA